MRVEEMMEIAAGILGAGGAGAGGIDRVFVFAIGCVRDIDSVFLSTLVETPP